MRGWIINLDRVIFRDHSMELFITGVSILLIIQFISITSPTKNILLIIYLLSYFLLIL